MHNIDDLLLELKRKDEIIDALTFFANKIKVLESVQHIHNMQESTLSEEELAKFLDENETLREENEKLKSEKAKLAKQVNELKKVEIINNDKRHKKKIGSGLSRRRRTRGMV